MPTLQNFGVPTGDGNRGGFLQPKTQYKFRVRVMNFGPVTGGIELTQQTVTVGRPTVSTGSETIHSYNSIGYYAGKAEWETINLVVRDDVTNSVSRLVSHQEQKQMNHFQQTSPLAGQNYKFGMFIQTMDGGTDGVLETWELEGCFLTSIQWGDFDYSSSSPMTINMTIRYDNATQDGGIMPANPQFSPSANNGSMF